MLHNLKVHTRTLFYEKKEMHQVCKSVPVGAACAVKVTPGIFLHFFLHKSVSFFLAIMIITLVVLLYLLAPAVVHPSIFILTC